MNLRERRLLRRLRERDEKAFREMVEEYGDRVFNLTYRMMGSREEAEDIAQEVFITVFKSIDSFREESKFSTWLYRITANHCKNRIKFLARRHQKDKSEFDERIAHQSSRSAAMVVPNPSLRPDAAFEGAQLERRMQEAIASLEEDHRILIVLRDVEELSYDEISQITGLRDGTVKSRLHRARLALRKKMSKYLGGA